MLKINSFFLQRHWTIRTPIAAVWKVYRQSRVVRVASRLAALPLLLVLCGAIYVSYNRKNLPDLDAFLRFEPSTTGRIFDANGHVLVELGSERREIIQYKNIPDVLRQAILSAEDENFFSHSGVDYSVFPRLLGKTNFHAIFNHFEGSGGEHAAERASVFPQGGSTLTQQLVRGYFLQKLTSTKNSNTLQHEGLFPHALALIIGVHGANRVLLKVEEIRLSLWIEGEMRKRYGALSHFCSRRLRDSFSEGGLLLILNCRFDSKEIVLEPPLSLQLPAGRRPAMGLSRETRSE